MKRKTTIILSLLLVALLAVLSGCSGKTTLMTYNGTKIHEDQLYYELYSHTLSSAGTIDDYPADLKEIKKAIDDKIDSDEQYTDYFKQQKVIFIAQHIFRLRSLELADELGITLSEEEIASINDQVEELEEVYADEDTAAYYESYFKADGKDINKYLDRHQKHYLGAYGANNFTEFKKVLEEESIADKILTRQSDTVEDDEESVRAYYNSLIAQQKLSYEDLKNFTYDEMMGETIVYYPEGLRRVKHILFKYSDEDSAKMSEYEDVIEDLTDKEDLSDEEKKKLEETQSALDKLKTSADQELKEKADAVYTRLQNGEDFDTLLAEYGEDPGMQAGSDDLEAGGYLVNETASYVKEFLDASLALEKVGDISQPVLSSFGYHIVQYSKEVPSGEVNYEDVHDQLLTTAMEEKRTAAMKKYYLEVVTEIMEGDKVDINYDALGVSKEEILEMLNKFYGADAAE